MADEERAYRPEPIIRIDTTGSRHDNNKLRPSRTRSTTNRSDANAQAILKRQFAIPTPLHSPHHSRNPSTAVSLSSSGDHTNNAAIEKALSYQSHHDSESGHLLWRVRIKHFTWTWFCMTMATGQIANCIAAVPFRFRGLNTIGLIFMHLNIVLFILNTIAILTRFRLYPKIFWSSLTHPTESLFVPAFVISLGTILMNITVYGIDATGPWLEHAMLALFWAYCVLAMASACGIYLIMWSTQTFTLSRMTPVWIFPAYPLLVIAPHAAVLAERIPDKAHALGVVVGGVALQGIGFMVSLMVYAAFLYRLMTNKLPQESLRPGMFISVGPSGFTVAGLVGLGKVIGSVIPVDFMGVGEIAGVVSMVLANWVGVWLWGLAVFFFITGTFAVGMAFNNRPIEILGCIFTIMIIMIWLFVFVMMIRAVYLKQILWPQKQEDRDEGRWVFEKDASATTTGVHTDVESMAGLDFRDGGIQDSDDADDINRTRAIGGGT
ncbi:Voltage-dependent anion channel-like protein 1 [Elsinoe fawcettii]|nr:Voltage-dependent anion channel-like protein 1 [Elsinoe fawcettii]